MGEVREYRLGNRSLFWPLVLITIGVLWLLSNLGVISAANLFVLVRLWPLLLIIVGLDLLFGRQSRSMGNLIGVGAVVLIVFVVLVGPSLGLAGPNLDITQSSFNEPVEDATDATINLDLSLAATSIYTLTDSNDLFTAEVSHVGELDYSVSGNTSKTIRLAQRDTDSTDGFMGLDFLAPVFGVQRDELYWRVGLSPDVLLTLNIDGGVGQTDFDLSGLQLESVSINGGVGEINLTLPAAQDTTYEVALNGGVGSVNIDVPEGAAVRMMGNGGIGNITVPAGFTRVGDDDDDDGVWQTTGYEDSAPHILINYNGGIGALTLR
ncbi:MAG: hypothetical protein CL610_27305 [Anaerolineaceae bacterium]|nr:hypothetical protein [Anaerolineaceae bacterium]